LINFVNFAPKNPKAKTLNAVFSLYPHPSIPNSQTSDQKSLNPMPQTVSP